MIVSWNPSVVSKATLRVANFHTGVLAPTKVLAGAATDLRPVLAYRMSVLVLAQAIDKSEVEVAFTTWSFPVLAIGG